MENERIPAQETSAAPAPQESPAVARGATSGFQKEHNEKEAEISPDAAAEGNRDKSDAV